MQPPMFYTDGFYQRCHELVLHHFEIDINSDINTSNALQVYLFLVDNHNDVVRV